ncbi:glutamine amidotransferase subunit [Linnemannia gamsii]|uniref:Glutamine amidotransferase subunit n=1 Tax=Linnemannia gamsii TaxID=64522 RepID=A0ABQ7KBU7_9FUNG|nr:glutamine amidotransferase subunit [Linnemannia gamsii]
MLLYKGRQPIQLAHLLTKPAHSIINQSFDSRLRLDHRRPINGDGFGVGKFLSTISAVLVFDGIGVSQ